MFNLFLGFHEAIGDTMALAVNTPAHLEGLGLLPKTSLSGSKDEEKENIAYLFHVALQKVSFLLEPVCCKKRQKSPNQETGLGIRGQLKVLNVPNWS